MTSQKSGQVAHDNDWAELMDDPDETITWTLERVRRGWAEHRTHVDQGEVGDAVHDRKVPEGPEPEGGEDPGKIQSLKQNIGQISN